MPESRENTVINGADIRESAMRIGNGDGRQMFLLFYAQLLLTVIIVIIVIYSKEIVGYVAVQVSDLTYLIYLK